MSIDRRATSIVYSTYDNKYYIRKKHGENQKNIWLVTESGNLIEKSFIGSLEECKQYIYDNLYDDNGHKYKLEHINTLNARAYTRIIVNYDVKVTRLKDDKKIYLDATVANISSGGCKIKINSQIFSLFETEELILIQFNLSDFDINKVGKLEIEAEIRWLPPLGNEFGCQFKEMNEESDRIFSSIIEKLIF